MSYAIGAALQIAVFERLEADATLAGLVGDAVFDAAPAGPLPGTYVVLGPEEVRDRSDANHHGARHDFTISVVTDSAGFQVAKTVAAAVSDALTDVDLTLSRGRLISLRFLRATAVRAENGAHRKVDLRFRALVEDN